MQGAASLPAMAAAAARHAQLQRDARAAALRERAAAASLAALPAVGSAAAVARLPIGEGVLLELDAETARVLLEARRRSAAAAAAAAADALGEAAEVCRPIPAWLMSGANVKV